MKEVLLVGDLIVTTSMISSFVSENNWRNFFEGCQKCSSISELVICRSPSFDSSYFYREMGDDSLSSYSFDGSNVLSMKFKGYTASSSQFSQLISLNGFEVLTGVKKLTLLYLNELEDFSALSKLNNLESLSIQYCKMTDLSELIDMENLSTPKKLKDLSIKNVPSLGHLDCLSNEETCKVFSNLTSLTLNDCGVSSCSYFENMTQLTYLDLRNNTIGPNGNNLGILENLHNTKNGHLTSLYLTGNVGLKGTIENHDILKLKWDNKVWET